MLPNLSGCSVRKDDADADTGAKQARGQEEAWPHLLDALPLGTLPAPSMPVTVADLTPDDWFRPEQERRGHRVAEILRSTEYQFKVAGMAPSELFDEGAILTATLDSSKEYTPVDALVNDLKDHVREEREAADRGQNFLPLPHSGGWIVRELLRAAWHDLAYIEELNPKDGESFYAPLSTSYDRGSGNFLVDPDTAVVVGKGGFRAEDARFHDDGKPGLVVIFAFSDVEESDVLHPINPRIGTRFLHEATGNLYQHAGPSWGRAVTVQVFPAQSDVFNHAVPIMNASSERYSLGVRLPIKHKHTSANHDLYARVSKHVMDKIKSWGEMEVPELRAEHEKVRTSQRPLFPGWREAERDEL